MPTKKPTTAHQHDHDHDHHDHDGHDHSGHTHTHAPKTKNDMIADNTVLKMVIPAATTTRAYAQALAKLATQLKLEGFRPGKVPAKLAEEHLGFERIVQEALDRVVPAAYERLIQKEGKQPLGQPDIKVTKLDRDQDWELEVQIAERPAVKLGKYADAVKKAHKAATKALADQEKKAAKDAKPLTDAQKDEQTLQEIYRALLSEIKVQIPELLLRHETQQYLEDLMRRLSSLNITLEQYLASQQLTPEKLTENVAASSLGSLQLEFILSEIGASAKLEPTAEEVAAETKTRSEAEHLDLDNPYLKDFILRTLRRRKISEYLLALK